MMGRAVLNHVGCRQPFWTVGIGDSNPYCSSPSLHCLIQESILAPVADSLASSPSYFSDISSELSDTYSTQNCTQKGFQFLHDVQSYFG